VDEEALAASYSKAVNAKPPVLAPVASRRARTERGQGQLWMMIGSPCAMRHEGEWDAGVTATAVTAAAAESADPAVSIEPWVSADGVGIIAHGAVLDAEETPDALARRVARAAAHAYASLPRDAGAFARAQHIALRHTGADAGGA